MLFEEDQLKQLRAQCIVHLALKEGLTPKRQHLEIALGNEFPKQDIPGKELINHQVKGQSSKEPVPDIAILFGRMKNEGRSDMIPKLVSSIGTFPDADLLSEDAKKLIIGHNNDSPVDSSETADERA